MSSQPLDFSDLGGKQVAPAPTAGKIDFSDLGGRQVQAAPPPRDENYYGAEASFPTGEPGNRIGPKEIAAVGIMGAPILAELGATWPLIARVGAMTGYGALQGAGEGGAAQHPSGRDILETAASRGLLYGGGEAGAGIVQKAFNFLRGLTGLSKAASASAAEATAAPEAATAAETAGAVPPKPSVSPAPGPMPTVAAKPAGDVIAERLGILDRDPQSLITSALKPGTNNIKWAPDMAKAFPDLKAAETQLGRPVKTFADAKEAATIAKENLWNQYTQKLEQARAVDAGPLQMRNPQTGQLQAVTHEPTIDGNQVADAMEAAIDKRTAAQNPALVDRIEAVAKTYRRPMKLDEAEEFLQSANNELNSYYAKNKVGQQVAARDPETGHVVAEASALRQALYSKLDELTGPGAAELKQRYGAISNFQDVLLHRENVALRQQPVSLAEQISKARAYGKIAVGVARGDPWSVYEGVQQSTAATWLKERQTSEAMMERAFANYGRPGVSGPTAAVAPRIPTAGVAVRAGAGSLPVGSDYENVAP